MGEGTLGLSASRNGGAGASARTTAHRLDDEIAMLREDLTKLVSELDRRRHEALDVKLQIKRRAPGLAAGAVALVLAASGFVWWKARRARQMPTIGARASDLRERLSRMIHPPEPEREPNVVVRVLTTAATAAAATAMKRAIDWGMRSVLEYRRLEEARRGTRADQVTATLAPLSLADRPRPVTTRPLPAAAWASTPTSAGAPLTSNGGRARSEVVGESAPESVIATSPSGSRGGITR